MIGQSAYAGLRILQISLAGFQHKFVVPGFTESSDSFEHQRAYDERHYDPVRDVQETLPSPWPASWARPGRYLPLNL